MGWEMKWGHSKEAENGNGKWARRKKEERGRKRKKGGRGKGEDEYNVMSYDIGDACGSRKMTIIRSLLNFSLNTPENLMEPTLTNCSLIRGASLSLSAASVYRLSISFSGLDPLHPSSSVFFSPPQSTETHSKSQGQLPAGSCYWCRQSSHFIQSYLSGTSEFHLAKQISNV